MNQNVVVIKRHQKGPFPNLWPQATLESVAHALHRNQPVERVPSAAYHFALKPDIAGGVFSVIVQPNATVLYDQSRVNKAESETFMKWYIKNQPKLLALGEMGFYGMFVGKMLRIEEVDTFLVYYVVQRGKQVYVDHPNIDRLLKLRADHFDGTVHAVPVEKIGLIRIDKPAGDVAIKDVIEGLSGSYVGFPITSLEPRLAEDGSESIGISPRLFSTDVHMRYSAFVHNMTGTRRFRIDDLAPNVGKYQS